MTVSTQTQIYSLKDLPTIAHNVLHSLNQLDANNKILLLEGDLSSGKTTLIKSIAKILNIKSIITSPTFSIQNHYVSDHKENLYHYDIYKTTLDELLNLGLFDMLELEGYHIIEWGDANLYKLLQNNGFKALWLHISHTSSSTRTYTYKGHQ